MYNNDFVRARAELLKAFGMASNQPEHFNNKQRILRYLVPVEMINGRFPSKVLLERYQLREYIEVTEACLNGEMPDLEAAISANQDQYI